MKKSKRTISKKKYIRKTKHNRRTKRIAGGNILEEIDLRQILITTPIINAVKEYNTDIQTK